MRGLLLLAPALALVLAACGGSPSPSPTGNPTKAAPARTTASPSPTPSPTYRQKATSNVHACYDGKCVLKVSGPKTVPVDKGTFDITGLKIEEIAPDGVRVRFVGAGYMEEKLPLGGEQGWVGPNGDKTLTVRVMLIQNGTAVLSFKAK